jgi:sulfur-oxidizing protein SoxA
MTRIAAGLIVLSCIVSSAAQSPGADPGKLSGYAFLGRETRAMQDDDTGNPGFLWVQQGAALWAERLGPTGRACADCHGADGASMAGVATRYPAVDAASGRLFDLEDRIQQCRADRQEGPPLRRESDPLLALTAFVATQSRGLPIAVRIDGPAQPFFDAGRRLFETRQGQLDLACAQCHDDNWGKRLAGSSVPQGHPTGYPLYRLEWQSLGSLQRRLRNCMIGVRADPFEYGAPEYAELALFLADRARGLPIETPAVRP